MRVIVSNRNDNTETSVCFQSKKTKKCMTQKLAISLSYDLRKNCKPSP